MQTKLFIFFEKWFGSELVLPYVKMWRKNLGSLILELKDATNDATNDANKMCNKEKNLATN